MELVSGKTVTRPDIPELMGAYGAGLVAIEQWQKDHHASSKFVGLEQSEVAFEHTKRNLNCKGCENLCQVTLMKFPSGEQFYSGNRCEKEFVSRGNSAVRGENMYAILRRALFDRPLTPEDTPKGRIGIPRALNMFEDFPFWATLWVKLGYEVVLSSPSSVKIYEKGQGTIMSDNICYPAKLTHGHIFDLAEQGVDRIFYPMATFGARHHKDATESFNCPIITGYPDVIRSAINPEARFGIPFDTPPVTFHKESLLKKGSWVYFKQFGVTKKEFDKAFDSALAEAGAFRKLTLDTASQIAKNALENNRLLVVLAGRPYHLDPAINHKIPDLFAEMGVDVITSDISTDESSGWSSLGGVDALTMWSYPNRIFGSAGWVIKHPQVQFVQLNSFGCGPDAVTIDEVKAMLESHSLNPTLVRIDEITSQGSLKLRVRSLLDSLKLRDVPEVTENTRQTVKLFTEADRFRTILLPYFSQFHTFFLANSFKKQGFTVEILPPPDRESVEYGLKYATNDICYPATIIIGDLLKALKSGKYDPDKTAVGITATGGQCRATSYLSILKKGMITAGFPNSPVVGISVSGMNIDGQPGFKTNKIKLFYDLFQNMLISDALSTMYYATIVREKRKGDSDGLLNLYFERANEIKGFDSLDQAIRLIGSAAHDFNSIEIVDKRLPKVLIVGEIFVKYNSFANNNVVDWLMERGCEVVVPHILDFFAQDIVNLEVNEEKNILDPSIWLSGGIRLLNSAVNHYIHKANEALRPFRYYAPMHTANEIAGYAEQAISLTDQFGEAWLIPGEILAYAHSGVKNVVSVQPFGCIANHIVARGVEKRLKDLVPDLNILYLDADAGTSEANNVNRLHFFLQNSRSSHKKRLTLLEGVRWNG